MADVRFLTVSVVCPTSETRAAREMPLDVVFNGTDWILLPCNGCDDMNGSKVCKQYREAVTNAYCNGIIGDGSIFYPEHSQ